MSPKALQQPIGFSPREVSSLINETVVEQHVEESAFLWTSRDRAVSASNYKLKDLRRLDERVEAHLDGLRVSGIFGRQLCEQSLDKKEAGEIFAAAVTAISASDRSLLEKVLKFSSIKLLARGLISGLGWLPFPKAENTIKECLKSTDPATRRIGIAASAVHRVDPGLALRETIGDPDPYLRARALFAVGELGRIELLPRLRNGFTASNQEVRFAAAWSATRMSENLDSLAILREIAESANPYREQALQIAVRRMDLPTAKLWQTSLVSRGKLRSAVIAAGEIGDPALVSWIIRQMSLPSVARVAGQAFSMITGLDLAYEDLDGEKPEGDEVELNESSKNEALGMRPDINLRWPSQSLISKWWNENQGRFQSGRRYLKGGTIGIGSLRATLSQGTQTERATAALELALLDPNQPLFEVRARAQNQLDELQRWS